MPVRLRETQGRISALLRGSPAASRSISSSSTAGAGVIARRDVRFSLECVAELPLRTEANRDFVGLRLWSAGACDDGAAGRQAGPVLL